MAAECVFCAPLEIRCAWGAQRDYCFTTTALTSKIWLIYEQDGEWHSKAVADIGDASKIPLPVDISISADDNLLWVNTWNDGLTRVFDVSDPHQPKEVYTKNIGARYGGAISAALFLRKFVGEHTWAHIDLAGPAMAESAWEYICRGGTGFGVATLAEYVERAGA